jgi:hypothetical protein
VLDPIHAIADAKGRLLSILLTGGQAHDCPPAQRLICRTKPAKKLLGDKAYLSLHRFLALLVEAAHRAWRETLTAGRPVGTEAAQRIFHRTAFSAPLGVSFLVDACSFLAVHSD